MATRSSDRRPAGWLAVAAAVAISGAALAQTPAPAARESDRAAARIKALQRETERLAGQESTLLGELRRLEIDRELKTAELSRIEAEERDVQAQIAASTAKAAALEQTVESERPEIAGRIVRLYTLGRFGFWRLLLDVDSLRSVGRAYRTASAVTRLDRERVAAHEKTLDALAGERATLASRAEALKALEGQARAARAEIAKAVAARTALVASIDARRDLNAQLVGELQAAQERLDASVSRLEGGPTVVLPIKAFRGALPWPAAGSLIGRFGQAGPGATASKGLEIATAAGQPVLAVHEGTVAYADAFTGYGQLVILEHGAGTYTLYGYLSDIEVAKGAFVPAQAPLGRTGATPAGKPALYFELRVDGRPVDPVQWLARR